MQKAISAVSTDVQLVKGDLRHVQEMMVSRFSAVESGQQATNAKLDQLILMGQQVSSDPTLTAAGKSLVDGLNRHAGLLERLSVKVDAHDDAITEARGVAKGVRLVFGTSALAALGSIVAIWLSVAQFLGNH